MAVIRTHLLSRLLVNVVKKRGDETKSVTEINFIICFVMGT